MICVYQGITLMNDHMNGEFPVLKPGANAISWMGKVTRVVVRPNRRFLCFFEKGIDSYAT